MELVEQYRTLNESFKSKLVYHLGAEAGFFSEFNNMILAMLYCIKHNIQFELFSKDANFGYEKGWQDYFLPFCNESNVTLHSKLNPRQPAREIALKNKFKIFLFKICTKTEYFTFDLWNEFHSKNFEKFYFDLPLLNIKGNIQQACAKLIDLTWRYNKETEDEINEIISSLNIPEHYIGMHIRGGDKFIEYEKVEVDKYIDIALQKSDLRDVFLLTDDYRIIIQMRKDYPTWNFFTLCDENERGYFHTEFVNSNTEYKKNKIIKLFSSVDVLNKAEHFIGTFSSNPGMYLGMRMKDSKVHGVDLGHWTIW